MPFHSWTPDVYQGAPTPVTGFMAACTKIAAFGALMRVFYVALGGARWDWQPMMWIVAVLTMVVGSIVAITQTDVKRMLAYSSIAHAGFLLTAFVGRSQASSGNHDRDHLASGGAVLPGAYGFRRRRVRRRHAGAGRGRRGDAPVALGRARQGVAARWPASSRSSCSPSPGSR